MSRVLRRPMFRGGYVDSEGTGITSGLDTPKRGLVDGPGGYAGELSFGERFRMAMEQDNANKKARSDALKSDKSYNLDLGLNDIYNSLSSPTSVLQSIYDAINPSAETILKRIQERQAAQGEPIIKTQAYREEQKIIAKAVEDKQKAEELKRKEEEKLKTITTETGAGGNSIVGGNQQTTKTDLRTVYEDLLPLFQKELGAADDEFSRQKYLELAKFGLNLLRQPGGPPGGERNLLGAIAASAEKPLEGYQTILAKEKQAQRLPKALALEAAMKEVEPGNIMRQVRDIQRLNPNLSASEALNKILSTGQATVGETTERRIKTNAEALKSEIGESAGLKLSRTIERSGVDYSQITKIPKDKKGNIEKEKITEGYYYDEEGKLYKVGKDKNIQTVVVK